MNSRNKAQAFAFWARRGPILWPVSQPVADAPEPIAYRASVAPADSGGAEMFTAYFWKSALERALKSFAQALLAVLGAGQAGVLDVAWAPALSTAVMAGLLSALTSVASARVGARDDPSLVKPADSVPAVGPRHVAVAA